MSPPSCTKNSASISARDRTPRNCAWLPSSVQSFGAGVAVAQSLVGVATKASSRVFAGSSRVVLDNARFIQHNTTEARNVKLVQPVVIRDGDARSNVCAFAGVRHGNADAFSFLDRLLGDGERARSAQSRPVSRWIMSAHANCMRLCQGRSSAKIAAPPGAAPIPVRSRWCGNNRAVVAQLVRRCLLRPPCRVSRQIRDIPTSSPRIHACQQRGSTDVARTPARYNCLVVRSGVARRHPKSFRLGRRARPFRNCATLPGIPHVPGVSGRSARIPVVRHRHEGGSVSAVNRQRVVGDNALIRRQHRPCKQNHCCRSGSRSCPLRTLPPSRASRARCFHDRFSARLDATNSARVFREIIVPVLSHNGHGSAKFESPCRCQFAADYRF